MEPDVEQILNWSEYLFNPRGNHLHPKLWLPGMAELPLNRYQAQNESFMERYGSGLRTARTIMMTGRQTGRSTISADGMALLRRIFGPPAEVQSPPPPQPSPQQERNRRRFLRG